MTLHEQDPDILRWGLHLLLGDDTSNSEETTRDDAGNYDEGRSRRSDYEETTRDDPDNYDTENDAVIAHALQEEFSQLAIAEASGSSHEDEEHLQASVLAQDWSYPSTRNFDSGNASSHDQMDAEPCSSSGNMLNEGDDWPLEFTDFSVLDGEVGKRLNQMVPVPHVPRTIGEIPSVDEAMSDHERLLERLRLYELVELKVQGDGNCQFRALSDQFYRTPEHHKFVREQVVNQLKAFPEIYEGYVPMDYEEYIRKMSKCDLTLLIS